jgi:hypothetical protein
MEFSLSSICRAITSQLLQKLFYIRFLGKCGQYTFRRIKITFRCLLQCLLDLLIVMAVLPIVWKQYQTGTPQKDEYARMILDQIDADEEHVYIFDIYAQPPSQSSAFDFWEATPSDYCLNRFALGGWNARLPYRVELLEAYGIQNPVRSLYENPDVYSLFSGRILTHLRQYYDSSICVSNVKSIGSYPFVQYSAFVDHTSATASEDQAFLKALYYSDSGSLPGWFLKVELEGGSVDSSPERELYCNILVDGAWRSYRLLSQGQTASACLWEIGTDYDFDSAEMVLVEKLDNGEIVTRQILR